MTETEKPIAQAVGRCMTRTTPTTRSEADVAAEEQRQRDEKERRHRAELWEQLCRERGSRYAGCTLDTYRITSKPQLDIVHRLASYLSELPKRVAEGEGIVPYGPTGTGKDHLAWSLVRHAVLKYGLTVAWTSGAALFGDRRDAISNDLPERLFIRQYTAPDVWLISDPLPPMAELSDYQRSVLYRILDDRNNNCRPTWCTINVRGRREFDERISPQIADRLIDRALTLQCDWESYRAANKPTDKKVG